MGNLGKGLGPGFRGTLGGGGGCQREDLGGDYLLERVGRYRGRLVCLS